MRQSHPELFILLYLGIKPNALIARGYSKATIYKYNRQMPAIKKAVNGLLQV